MLYSKMSQLSASSWVNSTDSLITSYRTFSKDGTAASKGRLALSATIDAVKAIAYTIISAVGLVIYALSCGKWHNKPWSYACLHTQMSAAAVYAIFKFKPAMEQLRVAEAKAFCRSLMLGEQVETTLNLTNKKLTTLEIEQNAFSKLKSLNAHQLAHAISIPHDASQVGKYLETLYCVAAALPASEQLVVNNRIETIQKQLHTSNKDKPLTFAYVSPSHTRGVVAFCPIDRRAVLEAMYPDLKDKMAQMEKAEGAARIHVTEQQCLIAAYLAQSTFNYYSSNTRYYGAPSSVNSIDNKRLPQPAPQELNRLTQIAQQEGWSTISEQAKRDARENVYREVMKEVKSGKIEERMRNGSLSASKVFDILRNDSTYSNVEDRVPAALVESCVKYLLARVDQPEMMNISKEDAEVLRRKLTYNTYRPIAKCEEIALEFVLTCLSKGNITLLNELAKEKILAASADDRVKKAWENSSLKVRCDAMPSLYRLSLEYPHNQLETKKMRCPELSKAVLDYAKDRGTLARADARPACEETLKLYVTASDQDNKQDFGKSLRGRALETLQIAMDQIALRHNLEALRDASVDVILKNVAKYAAFWLSKDQKLLTDALKETKRGPSFDRSYGSAEICADEGLALAKFSKGNGDNNLRDACKQYIKNNPAYYAAVQSFPVDKRKPYEDLIEICTT